MDIRLLRESFDSQLRVVLVKKEVVYMEIFEADEILREALFKEYCEFAPEPDSETYRKHRLEQEGISTDDQSEDFNEANGPLLNKINREFEAYLVEEYKYNEYGEKTFKSLRKIAPEYKRPQLEKSYTFEKLKEIDTWQKDLIKDLIEKDRDKIEMPVFINRILRLLGELIISYSHRIAQKIHDDDLSNKITDNVIFNSWVDERFGSEEQVPMVDLGFSPIDQTLHPEKPEVKQKDQILRDWRHVRAILQDGLKPVLLQQNDLQFPESDTNPDIPQKLISFDKPETIDKLFSELKGYFQEYTLELKKALEGEQLDKPLFFPHNQNKFVEVFKRIKYNGYLISTPTEIRDWICSNFKYRYRKGKVSEVRAFNKSTVWDILTKDKGEPTIKERICTTDWLIYKSFSRRKVEAEKEKL